MASMDRILLISITLLLITLASSTYVPANYADYVASDSAAKKVCPIHFGHQNYTAVTDNCPPRGPEYPEEACCQGFLQFACPFAKYIDDLTTDCAITMDYYINSYGYPPGLFLKVCNKHADNIGIPCPKSHS